MITIKIFARTFTLMIIFFMMESFGVSRINYEDARLKNVCKDLSKDALVYFIFVDNKETSPWTEFDIQSTLDSIRIAINWIERKAKGSNVILNIKYDYYIGEQYSTINKKLPQKSVGESATTPNLEEGLSSLNSWADKLCKFAGTNVAIDTKDGIPDIEQPKNKERLAAYLRDKYAVESVALVFMVNNYFKDDISIAVNTMNTKDIEFAIVSYKYPADIAHNILHLYGACDLFETPFRKDKKKINELQSLFPYDIMGETSGRSIERYEIGEITKYLIGWNDRVKEEYTPFLKDKLTLAR